MARRSGVQQGPRIPGGPELSAYPESLEFGDSSATGRRGSRRGRWSGGGGRWLVWTGRAILWALIIVIVVNGIRAPFERFTQPSTAAPQTAVTTDGFPADRASAFATQFANNYLDLDSAGSSGRALRLAPYLPDGVDDGQFGWD